MYRLNPLWTPFLVEGNFCKGFPWGANSVLSTRTLCSPISLGTQDGVGRVLSLVGEPVQETKRLEEVKI